MADTRVDLFSKRVSLEEWSRFDVAIEKPYIYAEATQTSIAYIKNNQAYITNSNFPLYYITGDERPLGPALDIACCYDARWRGDTEGHYTLFTLGNPYIALVDTANRLFVFQLNGPKIQLAAGVSKCCIVRGWKHTTNYTMDQGIVVWYVKQGRLYSRSYTQIDVAEYAWGAEKAHNIIGDIIDISAKRTADYRIMVSCITSIGNKLLLTDRMWPGQATPDEYVKVQVTDITKAIAKPIITHIEDNNSETISAIPVHKELFRLSNGGYGEASMSGINVSGEQIELCMNWLIPHEQLNTSPNLFKVTDEGGFVYPVTKAVYKYPVVTIDVLDFNNAEGNITVEIIEGFTLYDGRSIASRKCTFTPVGLIPKPPEPPVIEAVYNTNTGAS